MFIHLFLKKDNVELCNLNYLQYEEIRIYLYADNNFIICLKERNGGNVLFF